MSEKEVIKGWVMFKKTGNQGRGYGRQRHFINGMKSLCGQLILYNDDMKYIMIINKSRIPEKKICRSCLRRIEDGIDINFSA